MCMAGKNQETKPKLRPLHYFYFPPPYPCLVFQMSDAVAMDVLELDNWFWIFFISALILVVWFFSQYFT